MPSTLPRLPVRTSEALRALIAQAGPVNAATRALVILGAAAAGLSVRGLEREIYALLGCPDLVSPVRAALVAVARGEGASHAAIAHVLVRGVTGDSTGAVTEGLTGGVTEVETVEEFADDPLAGIGIEV